MFFYWRGETLQRVRPSSQYDARACVTLSRLRVDTRRNTSYTRIDLDSILAFLRLVMKIHENLNIFTLCKLWRDAMQRKGLASYCELSLRDA